MWYDNCLTIYDKEPHSISQDIYKEIEEGIYSLQSQEEEIIASVVIIAYNEERILPACLLSLALQKCKYPIEIIGIDNNSTDHTAEIFKKTGVRYFKEEKKGHGNARNCGLHHARGIYYLCMDSDTIYPPTYVEYVIDLLQQKGVVAVNATYGFFSDKFTPLNLRMYETIRNINTRIKSIKRPEVVARGLVFSFEIEPVREIGFRTNIKRGEDGAMAYELKQFGGIAFSYNKKCRALTSARSIEGKASIWHAIISQIKFQLKGFISIFYKRKGVLEDQPDNIIK